MTSAESPGTDCSNIRTVFTSAGRSIFEIRNPNPRITTAATIRTSQTRIPDSNAKADQIDGEELDCVMVFVAVDDPARVAVSDICWVSYVDEMFDVIEVFELDNSIFLRSTRRSVAD